MKICAVICEYDPFHNGHAYQLARIRKLTGCDRIVCLMSGNFTQRGNAAVFDKYTRARHAILGGADAVLELPAAFAVAPAELFARGAVHILASVPSIQTLAFGCESGNGTAESFMNTARAASRESKEFKSTLKERMQDGTSYAKARTETILALNTDIDEALLTAPNNMLGVEYCRAILAENADMVPLPIVRVGGGYADTSIYKDFSSATALRSVLGLKTMRARHALKNNLPEYVLPDALKYAPLNHETAVLCALVDATAEGLGGVPDCSEGIENRILVMMRTNPTYEGLLEKTVSKRYTRSRVKRILLQNFLGIQTKSVRAFTESPLYLRTLAVRKGDKDLLAALSESKFPLIVRKADSPLLKKTALDCFALDARANALYSMLSGQQLGDYETIFV